MSGCVMRSKININNIWYALEKCQRVKLMAEPPWVEVPVELHVGVPTCGGQCLCSELWH